MVSFEEPDRMEWRAEAQYKASGYAGGGMLLFIGLVLWGGFARSANKYDDLQAAKYEQLQALARATEAYQSALRAAMAEVMGATAYSVVLDKASAKALKDDGYLAAQETMKWADSAVFAASR